MNLPVSTLILMGFVFTSLGIIIGCLIGYLIASRTKESDKSALPHDETKTPSKPPKPARPADEPDSFTAMDSLPDKIGQVPAAKNLTQPLGTPVNTAGEKAVTSVLALKENPQTSAPLSAGSSVEKQKTASIVEQIDEILQNMLRASNIADTVISLSEDPRIGVLVRVNQNTYQGYLDIPDERVRTLIQSAVNEWNRQQDAHHRPAV